MSRPSAAARLRDSFGDRKPPDISRKITACVSCRKLKVKCNVASSGAPCTRCRTRGLSCTVNKSLQMILEDDASWKEMIERRLDALEKAPRQTDSIDNASAHDPAVVTEEAGISSTPLPGSGGSSGSNAAGLEPRGTEHSTLNLISNLGMFPATSVGSNTSPDVDLPTMDIISRGVVSLDVAEELLAYYYRHLNRFLHHVLNERDTLADIRARSSLLAAAICTVSSFCSSPDLYNACYGVFVNEVSSRLFAPHSSYDDVRALCIASMWLEEIGPTLIALAVRIGGRLDLHRCVTKMPHTKVECYDRTRLFYLLCLCDHHCSLKYGRPPMTQDWRSLKSPTTFLHSEFSSHRDLGLVSQLELWTTTRAVFERFGADVESLAAIHQSGEVYRLAQAYEAWHNAWCNILPADRMTASATELYYNFALLYLYSHIYRGSTKHSTAAVDPKIIELRNRFHGHAHAVLRIINDGELRLIDLPTYFGTMLAFASVSCIKTVHSHECNDDDEQDILRLLRQLAARMQRMEMPKPSSHPYTGIAKGLEQVTDGLEGSADQHQQFSSTITFDENLLTDDFWDVDFNDFGSNWMDFDRH